MNENELRKSIKHLAAVVNANSRNVAKKLETYNKNAFWMRLSTVVISASVTLVLGLKLEVYSTYIALILSSVLTVLAALDQFLNISTRHLSTARDRNLLSRLSMDIRYYLEYADKPTYEKFEEFKNRFDEMLEMKLASLDNAEKEIKQSIESIDKK